MLSVSIWVGMETSISGQVDDHGLCFALRSQLIKTTSLGGARQRDGQDEVRGRQFPSSYCIHVSTTIKYILRADVIPVGCVQFICDPFFFFQCPLFFYVRGFRCSVPRGKEARIAVWTSLSKSVRSRSRTKWKCILQVEPHRHVLPRLQFVV